MTQSDHILAHAHNHGLLSAADLRANGWSPQLLLKLHQSGKLQRMARGLYGLPNAQISQHQSLIEVCHQAPRAVICLLSALQFHDVGTQLPHAVWIAMPEGAQTPRLDTPMLRVTRMRGLAYSEGIQTVTASGSLIRVYSVAKTVCDCFKFRHKIGLDVAIEALKDGWRSRKFTMDELHQFAKINRVERIMQPYIEMVVA